MNLMVVSSEQYGNPGASIDKKSTTMAGTAVHTHTQTQQSKIQKTAKGAPRGNCGRKNKFVVIYCSRCRKSTICAKETPPGAR